MDLLQKAIYVALDAHEGQFDRGGHPYVNHPIYVSNMVEERTTKIVALLHDVVEDCDRYEVEDIRNLFNAEISEAVDAISKRKGKEEYGEYLNRVMSNKYATIVKLADIEHNLMEDRIQQKDEKYERMAKKYAKAKILLLERKREFESPISSLMNKVERDSETVDFSQIMNFKI